MTRITHIGGPTALFEGPHLLPAWPGWEEVADYALDWALEHARAGAAQRA